jgi:hypothetical protein
MPITAFYTLVQLIPDKLRDERLNVAVILQAPERQFAGIRVRKWMDRSIGRVFPNVDAELVRLITRGFAIEFSKFTYDIDNNQPILLQPTEVSSSHRPYDPDFLTRFSHGYSAISFSSPKPMTLLDNSSLVAKLEQLYERLVSVHEPKRQPANITKEQLEEIVVRHLYRKKVHINEKPPVFQGLHWPNKFDALKLKDNRRHLQFISFDQFEAPIAQAKAFLTSVEDMRQVDEKYKEDEFACILQPPKVNVGLQEDYLSAIATFGKARIITFENAPDDIDRLATGLESDDGLRSVA